MLANGLEEIVGAAVMEEEEALADAPQRRGAELVARSIALAHAVGEAVAHRVDGEVAEGRERRLRVGEERDRRRLLRDVALIAADRREDLASRRRRRCRRGRSR